MNREEFIHRFDEKPEDIEKREAQEKAHRVRTAELQELKNHSAWQQIMQHEAAHREALTKEVEQIKDTIVLAVTNDDIRALQMRHAYKRGILDGMKTIMNAPDDLSKPESAVAK